MSEAAKSAVLVYGIGNCDTVKKARAWLESHDVTYRFHDYRTDGIDRGRLERWCAELGWERLLNRAGTTFRKLADSEKRQLDAARAVALMLARPSLIKRPVLEGAGALCVGFSPELYAQATGRGRQSSA